MKKFNEMNIKQKLNFGYIIVICFMVLSGIVSIFALSMLDKGLTDFINGSNTADSAVKICRIDINIAARSIREAALNDDVSSFEGYKTKVEERLGEVDEQLKVMKATGLIDEELYQEYVDAIAEWGTAGWEILGLIEAGNREEAIDAILNECVPALDNLVEISKKLDIVTDEMMQKSIEESQRTFIVGVVLIIAFIVIAFVVAMQLAKRIVQSITEPLSEIEAVAKELTEGRLHSNLDYRSTDEIGSLAHSLRKAMRILSSYIDDITRGMQEFSEGNFRVEPQEQWKGDFVDIQILSLCLKKVWQIR